MSEQTEPAAETAEAAEAEWAIACNHGLFAPDPALNARLAAAGFTQDQAQLVYDLGAERLVPWLQEALGEMQAEREVERLVERFGGPEKYAEIARQMLAWGRKHLPEQALEGLAGSYEGVVALHGMMEGGEPETLRGETGAAAVDPAAMIRDPRYWRDRDPAFVAAVEAAFQARYPG